MIIASCVIDDIKGEHQFLEQRLGNNDMSHLPKNQASTQQLIILRTRKISFLKLGEALTPLLLNFPSEYAVGNVRETQGGLQLNWTHQPPVYADDIN
jgi:hypothetical protein